MTVPQDSCDYHQRFCALRNTKTSLVFLGYCSFEVILRWHSLGRGQEIEPRSAIFYIALVAVILALGDLVVALRCFRERLVLAVAIISFVFILMKGVLPSWTAAVAVPAARVLLILWTIALSVTLSMVVSLLRRPQGDSRLQ
jgi:hypothetical protein